MHNTICLACNAPFLSTRGTCSFQLYVIESSNIQRTKKKSEENTTPLSRPLQWKSGIFYYPAVGEVMSIDRYYIMYLFAKWNLVSANTARRQTELGAFFSSLYLSPSKERRSVELLELLYFIKRFRVEEISVYWYKLIVSQFSFRRFQCYKRVVFGSLRKIHFLPD
jgi:hypothetical protein